MLSILSVSLRFISTHLFLTGTILSCFLLYSSHQELWIIRPPQRILFLGFLWGHSRSSCCWFCYCCSSLLLSPTCLVSHCTQLCRIFFCCCYISLQIAFHYWFYFYSSLPRALALQIHSPLIMSMLILWLFIWAPLQ